MRNIVRFVLLCDEGSCDYLGHDPTAGLGEGFHVLALRGGSGTNDQVGSWPSRGKSNADLIQRATDEELFVRMKCIFQPVTGLGQQATNGHEFRWYGGPIFFPFLEGLFLLKQRLCINLPRSLSLSIKMKKFVSIVQQFLYRQFPII